MPTKLGFSLSEKEVTKIAGRDGENETSRAGLEYEISVWIHVYFYTDIYIYLYTYTNTDTCIHVVLYTMCISWLGQLRRTKNSDAPVAVTTLSTQALVSKTIL